MAKRTVKKIDHSKNIFETRTLPGKPPVGGLVEFKYKSDEVYDRIPVVFVLNVGAKLIEGININYLSDFRISKLLNEGTIKKLSGWEFYQKAYRTYSLKNITGKIKQVDYMTNRQLSEERDATQQREQNKQ